ncbi:hypothetical protein PMAYCL1PPCAC_08207, partial [Pristionchus mayeri]
QVFLRLCIPETFSEILRHLGHHDRLSLRLCTRAAADAVSRSDLHVVGRDGVMRINGCFKEFTISFGRGLSLKKNFEKELFPFCKKKYDEGLRQLVRVKERLFTQVYVESVEIVNINFNTISIGYIEKLLQGCCFKEISISIKRKEFSKEVIEFIHKSEGKRIILILKRFILDIGTLLSFKSLYSLQILK